MVTNNDLVARRVVQLTKASEPIGLAYRIRAQDKNSTTGASYTDVDPTEILATRCADRWRELTTQGYEEYPGAQEELKASVRDVDGSSVLVEFQLVSRSDAAMKLVSSPERLRRLRRLDDERTIVPPVIRATDKPRRMPLSTKEALNQYLDVYTFDYEAATVQAGKPKGSRQFVYAAA